MGYRRKRHKTTSDYLQLNVHHLSRDGSLIPGVKQSFSWTRGGLPAGSIQLHCLQKDVLELRGEELNAATLTAAAYQFKMNVNELW